MEYADLRDPFLRLLILKLAADLLRDPSTIKGGDRLRAFAVGPKTVGGRTTDEFALIVMPDRKVPSETLEFGGAHEHTVFDGAAILGRALFGVLAGVLADLWIRTDVVEIGAIQPRGVGVLGSAPAVTVGSPHFHNSYGGLRERRRPAPPGAAVGHRRLQGSGTIGAFLKDATGRRFCLSCNHVLALERGRIGPTAVGGTGVLASPGDPIIQPGLDVRFQPSHVFGTLTAWIDLQFGSGAGVRNYGDVALAEVDPAEIDTAIPYLQPSGGAAPVGPITRYLAEGAFVKKVGQASGLTFGRILHVGVPVRLNYGPGWAVLENQCVATHMSVPGDSGALVLGAASNDVFGLLFGGSNDVTLFTPMRQVLQLIERDVGLVLEIDR